MCTVESVFIEVNQVVELLKKEMRESFDEALFWCLLEKYLIIPVEKEEKKYIYKADVRLCEQLLKLNICVTRQEINQYGYNGSFFVERIKIADKTFLVYPKENRKSKVPAFVRNILLYFTDEEGITCELCQFDILNVTIVTTSLKVRDYVQNAVYRKFKLDSIKHSNFANSSSYMGSKKKIVGFIVEAMFPHFSDGSAFMDIMCGSGAVSNAMAQIGEVWASDAQLFCQLLAKIQGKGFDGKRAENLVKAMYPHYMKNIDALKNMLSGHLNEEDRIFHMDMNNMDAVLASYEKFINNYELYSTKSSYSDTVMDIVKARKNKPQTFPYCLFTYYYANVYFGLAQSIQLDSLRYAIDQICGEEEKEWALGSLVVVTSAIATTFGGHFAQPKRLDLNSVEMIIRQRQKSAWLEFSKRIVSLAEESGRYPFQVHILDGPWEMALDKVCSTANNQLVVYLDAPYKREEYSRYYHVLETIVKYDYPASEGKGRMRSKKNGERFKTEFFSKNKRIIENNFVKIICNILKKNAICVWSYSDNGDASIKNVVECVIASIECNVFIYAMPYVHQTQGKNSNRKIGNKKEVLEYCIVFEKGEKV